MMVVYSHSTGVVKNINHRHRKASFSTIAMHVDVIRAFQGFSCMRHIYPLFRIKIHFEGHLRRMNEIITLYEVLDIMV